MTGRGLAEASPGRASPIHFKTMLHTRDDPRVVLNVASELTIIRHRLPDGSLIPGNCAQELRTYIGSPGSSGS